jgi:O-methyltransferase
MSHGNTQIKPLMSSAPRGQHPWREILHRARDPQLVVDTGLRALAQTWSLISPSEFASLYRRVRNETMCSVARLRGLYRALRYVVRQDIAGDVVECGCARGGSAALMALTLRQLGSQRRLWLFDTFEGLPAPGPQDPDFEIADLFTGTCVGTLSEVRGLFDRLGAAGDVTFVKGLFQETLPITPVRRIALLHIDGDWYESVKVCLDSLYDKVVPGGVIQFDDYGYWEGARKAVDEFLETQGIQAPLQRLDYSGRFLIKPESLEAKSIKSASTAR